jgi:glycosyltransferase involved in cell wall biosynthesis
VKLLFISSLYHPCQVGGAEKVVRIVAEGMLQHGHESVVVTTQQGRDNRTAEVDGVRVHYLGLKNIFWPWEREARPGIAKAVWHGINSHNPLMARAVAGVLDSEKPDLVNTHNLTGLSTAVWQPVKSRGLPLIHTLHDYSLMCPKASMFRDGADCERQCSTCALYTAPAKRLSAAVDHVVGVSRFTLGRHLAAGYFPTAQARVIHNALPCTPRHHPRDDDSAGPLQLGYIGQLTPPKGIEALVRQMSAWDGSECQLLVAGKGAADYESTLRAQAPANVKFLGFVDPEELYRAIDVLVVPSLWQEPFATTVLEAFMHGVPVIVSRRGGLPEAVEAGRTGLVYEPKQPQGLRRAVETVLRDRSLLDDMRRRALERAEYFQLDRMRTEYLLLMEQARTQHAGNQPELQRSPI